MKAELRNLKELRPGSLQHILPSAPHGGRVAPQPGVSETEARASGDPSPDGNSVTSRHPFREKGPIRQGFDDLMCSSLPMCVALFLGWVGALAALHALDCDWALDDPGACALGVLLGFVIFELLTVRVSSIIYLRRFAHARPGAERVVSLVLLHGAAIWYGVARLSLPDAEADGVGTEVLRLLLLYASLIGVWALGRSETDNARVQNLLDQVCATRASRLPHPSILCRLPLLTPSPPRPPRASLSLCHPRAHPATLVCSRPSPKHKQIPSPPTPQPPLARASHADPGAAHGQRRNAAAARHPGGGRR